MKKTLATLLALVIVIGLSGTALAYDEEIVFQGISWGASVDETGETLMSKGILDKYLDAKESGIFWRNEIYFIPEDTLFEEGKILPKNYRKIIKLETTNPIGSYSFVPLKTIGGLEPLSVYLSYYIDEPSDSSLHLFSVLIDYTEPLGTNLLDQLKEKYGEPEIIENRYFANSRKLTVYIWNGKNKTKLLYATAVYKSRKQVAEYLLYENTDLSTKARTLIESAITPEPVKEDAEI